VLAQARIARPISIALLTLAFVSIVTPVCAMPGCDTPGPHACGASGGRYAHACGDGGAGCAETTVVMKHAPDDAIAPTVSPAPSVDALLSAEAAPALVLSERALAAPEQTAASPPRDPLGVRLTI